MTLSSLGIKAALGKAKPYKMIDGNGLYLLVTPTNSKLWRMDYRHGGKRKTWAVGAFPKVKLADAREQCEDARRDLKKGIEPARAKRSHKAEEDAEPGPTFTDLAVRWSEARRRRWTPAYAKRIWSRIEKDILSSIGDKAPEEVTPRGPAEGVAPHRGPRRGGDGASDPGPCRGHF